MAKIPSLRSAAAFREVYARGARARRDGVTVFVHPRVDDGPVRVGLSVGAGPGGAVVRNRVRRRIREAFERCTPAGGVDVAVRADRSVATMDFQELVRHLGEALQTAEARSQ